MVRLRLVLVDSIGIARDFHLLMLKSFKNNIYKFRQTKGLIYTIEDDHEAYKLFHLSNIFQV